MTHTLQAGGALEAMLPRAFRVAWKVAETADTVTVGLLPSDGGPIRFSPGQFTMFYVFGIGEVPVSISGDPGDDATLVHTVRSVGAVTEAIVGLEVGDVVGIRGPYGMGWPVDAAEGKDLVVVAGGIGLAPLRPVIYEALRRRERYSAVSVIYGARTPADLLFADELREWRGRFDVEVEVTVDRSDEGWLGDVGVVTGLLTRVPYQPGRTVAMLCGPEIMMKVVAKQLIGRGLSTGDIHVSLERNMKCAIGMCGHCQFGPEFICRDGPVLSYARVDQRLRVEEL